MKDNPGILSQPSEEQCVDDKFMPEMMGNLLHNMPGIAYRCQNDSKWTMLFLSEGCAKITGYQASELLGNSKTSYDNLIIPEDRDLVRDAVNKAVTNRTQFQIEYRIRRKDGEVAWVWELGNASYDAEGTPVYLDGYIANINMRKSLEFELLSTAEQLRGLNAVKDRFFSIIAHDLQNPVYAIISLSDFLSQNFDSFRMEELKDFIQQIGNSAKCMYLVLENLLDWTRMQSGVIKPQKEHFQLSAVLEDSMEGCQAQAEKKHVVCEIDIPEDTIIHSDRRMFGSILRNLISNAVKYSQFRGRVSVKAKIDKGLLELSVADQGTGIPRSELATLFSIERSYRRPGTMNEAGSGLGLILVADFAKRLGIEVKVESKLHKGSTFTLRMDLATP